MKIKLSSLWAHHHAEWRNPEDVITFSQQAQKINPELFELKIHGRWWEILEKEKLTLLVSREYEHLLLAFSVLNGKPHSTFMCLPHPSGIAFNTKKKLLSVASTRNPNQIFVFSPVKDLLDRKDLKYGKINDRPLMPTKINIYPGSMYVHDIAFINNKLYANAVAHNAIVELLDNGKFKYVWWPKCINKNGKPFFQRNAIQLNSIGAGNNLRSSYYSASSDVVSSRLPGQLNFPVNKKGVVFSGKTKEPIIRGLTRPHSVRLKDNNIWVLNSGYGEIGFGENEKFIPVQKFDSWTRGLRLYKNLAFVGMSRVIPKYKCYAPGLNINKSICGINIINSNTGQVLGGITWPKGNQIFAIEVIPNHITSGLPFGYRNMASKTELFYAFKT